ncbi:MAG TPA: DUF2059 domain-containing protein [Verrucomicrobiae bacterium]|nr:DUF2059 domain-containing protein [Verrucomicrobiae bacterium]
MKCAILICTFFLTASSALADEASKAAKVEEFLQLSNAQQAIHSVIDLMKGQMKSGLMQQLMDVDLTPEKQKEVDAFQDKLMTLVTDAIAWEKIKPDYIRIYSEAFTEKELDDLIGFYKSPTGQSMVSKMPQIIAKSGEVGQQKMMAIIPQLQKLMQDFITQQHTKK